MYGTLAGSDAFFLLVQTWSFDQVEYGSSAISVIINRLFQKWSFGMYVWSFGWFKDGPRAGLDIPCATLVGSNMVPLLVCR